MANYTIGDMIYENRVARGYSQEALSFGICSTSSLSRIENNMQVPSKKMFDALMQRLGVSESIYSSFISKEDMELFQLKQRLVWKLENFDFTDIDEMIRNMEKRLHGWNLLENQYLLFVRATVLQHRGGDPQQVLQMLLDAIQLTMPGFAEAGNIKSRLLTFDEITILNSIAIQYDELGDRRKALKLFFELKDYMEEHAIDEEEKAKKYPMILYNITIRLGAEKRYAEAFELCGLGIDFCIKHNKLVLLPCFINNKACAAAELGELHEAKEYFTQAYLLFKICKRDSFAEQIKTEAKNRYGFEI